MRYRPCLLVVLASGVVSTLYSAPEPKAPVLFCATAVATQWKYSGEAQTIATVTAAERKGGDTVITVKTKLQSVEIHEEKLRVSSKGLFRVIPNGGGEECRLKLPPTPGEKWEVEYTDGPFNYKAKYVCRGVNRIRVPAGEFRAIRVDWEYSYGPLNAGVVTNWYVAEIGLVRQTRKNADGTEEVIRELKSFSPGR